MKQRPQAVDLSARGFDEACRRLAEDIARFEPDLLVGIATGGAFVAEAMLAHLPSRPTLVTVKVQRPATSAKKALRLDAVVSRLPLSVTDLLRWLEVEYREATLRSDVLTDPQRAAALAQECGLHGIAPSSRCVIVDDTIDSGRTVRLAEAAVALAHPRATITTAVLASTWRNPPVVPDVCLFDRTLLRLPWSLDAPSLR
jgi:hypoxanthine phosphoribosyltransferase